MPPNMEIRGLHRPATKHTVYTHKYAVYCIYIYIFVGHNLRPIHLIFSESRRCFVFHQQFHSQYHCSQCGVGKQNSYNGESEWKGMWVSYGPLLPKTSRQVWSGPSWCSVCPSSLLPFTPTQTLLAL